MVATRSMARGSQGRARGLGVEARAASIVASPRPPLSRPRTAVRRFAPAWTTHSSRTSRGPERERSASSSGRVGVCMAAAPWPASVVTAVNMYAGALYVLLLSTAVLRWSRTAVRRLRAEILLLPICAAYLFLLVLSWKPDTVQILFPGSLEAGLSGKGFSPQFFPTLSGIAHLFSRCDVTASSMWLHLLAVNTFAAVQVCLDGLRKGIFTLHSIALCPLSGVLGFLSHYATKMWLQRGSSIEKRVDSTVVFKFK